MTTMHDNPQQAKQRLAILMATYNGEQYLREQIASLQAQTYTEWELFVADDGSSDHTAELVEQLSCEDPRIHVLRDTATRLGPCRRFFWLLEQVEADYYLFADQDDVWCANKVERLLEVVKATEAEQGKAEPILAFCDAEVDDQDLKTISPSFFRYERLDQTALELRQLLVCNVAPGCTMLFNRALADAVVVPSDAKGILMHDWWMMLTASALGTIQCVDEALIKYRQHTANTEGSHGYDLKRYTTQLREVAEAHIRCQRQAGVFAETYRMSLRKDDYDTCKAYGSMRAHGLQPVATIAKYKLWQPGIERRIGQIVLRIFRF